MEERNERDEKIDRIIALFEEMEAAFRLFVRVGNGLKWALYVGAAILGFLAAWKSVLK